MTEIGTVQVIIISTIMSVHGVYCRLFKKWMLAIDFLPRLDAQWQSMT